MKKAKYIIFFIIVIAIILLSGEVGQNIIGTFENGTRYILFESGDMGEWEEFCKEISSECKAKNIFLFAKYEQTNGIRQGNISIFAFDEMRIKEMYGIESGEFMSMFSGKTKIEVLPFDCLSEQEVGSAKFYMTGDNKDIINIYNYLNDKYGTSRIRNDSENIMENIFYLICAAGIFTILIMTLFDIAFQKKEVLVRLTLGDSIHRIIFKNILTDIIVYVILSFLAGAVLSNWISGDFFLNTIAAFLVVVCSVNSILYAIMYRQNVKKALANHFQNDNLLFFCYILKIITISVTIFSSAICVSTIRRHLDFIEQYNDIRYFEEYMHMDFKYYNLTDDTSRKYTYYTCSTFRDKYSEFETAFSVVSIDYDDTIYLNVNDNAKAVLHDIDEIEYINPDYKIHILIPNQLSDDTEYYVDNALDSGSCLYSKVADMDYEIIYYDSAEVLYFDGDLEMNTGIAKNPVICYFTSFTSEDFEPTTDENIQIIIHEFRNIMFKVDDDKINSLTEELELNKNGFYLTEVNTVEKYENYRKQILRKVYSNAVICILFVLFGMAITGTIVRLEYTSKSMELAVKKILGYSIIKKNKTILFSFMYTSAISIVIVVLIGIMTDYLDARVSFLMGICMTLLEFAFTYICIIKTEHRIVAKVLKRGAL
ncbi:MAG: hypothetical protein ACI4EW_07875 [Butyrivibrio sp.]